MEEKEIIIGGVVTLNSGGLPMTIIEFAWNPIKEERYIDRVVCEWFDGNGYKRQTFKISSLKHI